MTGLPVTYDPDFTPGAHSAVFTCLRVQPGERAVLITDRASMGIGAALDEQLRAAGALVDPFILEELAERPLKGFPDAITRAMESAQVSIFAAAAQQGELPARIAMTSLVNVYRIRH